ncbi:MAG: hypothetical protein ACM3RX_05195 [Methanococcaceae archaeon]
MLYNPIKKIYDTPKYHNRAVNGVSLASEGNMCWIEEELLSTLKRLIFSGERYIFFDTLPDESEVIRFRFDVELADDKVLLRVEERGSVTDTVTEQMMEVFYRDRKQKIVDRQHENFDLVLEETMINQKEFMIKYGIVLDNLTMAISLSKSIRKGVMSSVVNYFNL